MVNSADVTSFLMRLHGEMEKSSVKPRSTGQWSFAASLNESLNEARDEGSAANGEVAGAIAASKAGVPGAGVAESSRRKAVASVSAEAREVASAAKEPMPVSDESAVRAAGGSIAEGDGVAASRSVLVQGRTDIVKDDVEPVLSDERLAVAGQAQADPASTSEPVAVPDTTDAPRIDANDSILISKKISRAAAARGPAAAKAVSVAVAKVGEPESKGRVSGRPGAMTRKTDDGKISRKNACAGSEQTVSAGGLAPVEVARSTQVSVSAEGIVPGSFVLDAPPDAVGVTPVVIEGSVANSGSRGLIGSDGKLQKRAGEVFAFRGAEEDLAEFAAGQQGAGTAVKDTAAGHGHTQISRGDGGAAGERNNSHFAQNLVAQSSGVEQAAASTGAGGHAAEHVVALGAGPDAGTLTAVAGTIPSHAANELVKAPVSERGPTWGDGTAVTVELNSAGSSEQRPASAFEHRTIEATPSTLEVGVPNGTHGWLKIRAELTDTGAVRAALTPNSAVSVETLHRELPALQSFLEQARVVVSSVVVHAPASGLATGADGGGAGRHSQGDHAGSRGQAQGNSSVVDEGLLEDMVGLFEPGEIVSGLPSMGGGWLSVRA